MTVFCCELWFVCQSHVVVITRSDQASPPTNWWFWRKNLMETHRTEITKVMYLLSMRRTNARLAKLIPASHPAPCPSLITYRGAVHLKTDRLSMEFGAGSNCPSEQRSVWWTSPSYRAHSGLLSTCTPAPGPSLCRDMSEPLLGCPPLKDPHEVWAGARGSSRRLHRGKPSQQSGHASQHSGQRQHRGGGSSVNTPGSTVHEQEQRKFQSKTPPKLSQYTLLKKIKETLFYQGMAWLQLHFSDNDLVS